MQEHKVFLTYEAMYDIVDAEEYINYQFGEQRAYKYHNDIFKEFVRLSNIGTIFSPTNCVYRGYTIFKKSFSPAIIFWIVKEDGIHILRVTREEYDWQGFFDSHQDYEYTYPETPFL